MKILRAMNLIKILIKAGADPAQTFLDFSRDENRDIKVHIIDGLILKNQWRRNPLTNDELCRVQILTSKSEIET